MLTVHHISKSYGIETILQDVSFSLNDGERLGLVGPNGCGKTTLLRILTGSEQADSGVVHFNPPNLRVGYLAQGLAVESNETLEAFIARAEGDLPGLTTRLEGLAGDLTRSIDHSRLQKEYDRVLAQLEAASQNAGKGEEMLHALGLGHLPPQQPAASLSGGQKTRLALAGVLLSAPQLLLLDEPTNHLDIPMLEWLEDWLIHFPHAALIVSHDRAFLDHTVTGILEINPHTHILKQYEGNYSEYLDQKQAEEEKQWQAYDDQQVQIGRLRKAARHARQLSQARKGGKADTGDKFAKGFFANRSWVTMARAKTIERRIDHILNEERVDKPLRTWQMKIDFGDIPSSGRDVVVMEKLSVGYGTNILLRDLDLTVRYGTRLVLVGPNGCGKTTLLRTIAGMIEPLEGRLRIGSNVHIGYMTQEQESLKPEWNALQALSYHSALGETEARAFLSKYLFKGDDVFVPAGKLSYGERARLMLACLVAASNNFLMLDEPINHLDIPARTRFEEALANFDGTILAVVHDRYFIENFASQIWEVVDGGVRVIG